MFSQLFLRISTLLRTQMGHEILTSSEGTPAVRTFGFDFRGLYESGHIFTGGEYDGPECDSVVGG